MKCAVIGLGEFGRAAAIAMARSGVDVIAVDADLRLVDQVKDQVSLAVCLDATHEESLKPHGIAEAEVLVAAIGRDFEAQVLVVLYAKKLGIRRVVARATTPNHARILQLVGADEVVQPEVAAARLAVQRLLMPDVNSYFELADGFSVIEVDLPEAFVGKTLIDLNLRRRFRINLVAVKRLVPERRKLVFNPVPQPNDELQAGDILTLVGSDLDLARFMAEFTDDPG